MATELRLAGWKAENLRCPDHELSFEHKDGGLWPISLVQMPNGTGKTTTLQLLRACLGGVRPGDWSPQVVRQFRKKGSTKNQGLFEASLLCNNKRFTFRLLFDFNANTVEQTTTVKSGMKQGFHPPKELFRFLRPGFVNLFVFDGEQAALLLDSEHVNAETAIEDLFQLKTLNHISTRIEHYWEQKVAGRSAVQEKGLSQRRNRVAELVEMVATAKRKKSEATRHHSAALKSLEAKRAKYDADLKALEAVSSRLQGAAQAVAAADAEVKALSQAILRAMWNPASLSGSFAECMLGLKGGFDRVQLPETAAREFFEELAQEDECVCGRPLDDPCRHVIRERSSRYLGSDEVTLLNSMKSDIARLVPTGSEREVALQTDVVALEAAITAGDALRTERDAIEDGAVSNRPELEKARDEIRELERLVDGYETALKQFDDPDNQEVGIKYLERELRDAEVKLAEITDTLELKSKRDILKSLLAKALVTARTRLSAEVCRDANARIVKMLPNNDIRIDKIDRCLVLSGQEGGSMGETLSVAYAFLSTLFIRAEHSLPFIVDSPAGAIDLKVRSTVAALVPALSKQFIAFTISSEREGFLDPLEKAAGKDSIQFLTVFRKGGDDTESAAKRKRSHVETADGLVVTGREFFRTFHVDQQEA